MIRLDDTIAAIATPLLQSGLGVVRISGTKAISLVDTLFKGQPLTKVDSHKLVYGWILDQEELLDKVLVVVMRAPNSYTTEDVVEIHCHGSPFVLRKILSLVLSSGARLAEAGEFTQRAFLNGRIDLTQAEAISDLIHANSETGAKIAANQMSGRLFRAVDDVRKQIVYIASIVDANIEFPEEIQKFTQREECIKLLDQACDDLRKLLNNAELGRKIREGFSVTLIGKPNVGKSSLLNLMLREQRAIVTEIPGTTRDSIEEFVQIKGIPFRITDTAGIRKAENLIESEGIRRTQISREKADLVLLILDASTELNKEDYILINGIEKTKTIIVINKKDLINSNITPWQNSLTGLEYILVSAKNGEGLLQLESLLHEKASSASSLNQDEFWITNQRQLESAKNALNSLNLARKVLDEKHGEEFLAVDLKSSLNALGEIVGETTTDDLLEHIFSEFCIGK